MDRRLLTRSFVPFPVLHLVVGAYFGSVTVCLTSAALATGLGASAGLIAAGGGLASLATGFVYGGRAQHLDPLRVMLLASVVLAGAMVGLGQVVGAAGLVLLYVVAGGCVAPIVVPSAVLLQRCTPEATYVQAITWTGSASAAGTAIAAPVVGRLVDTASWSQGFTVTAALVALVPVVMAAMRAPARRAGSSS